MVDKTNQKSTKNKVSKKIQKQSKTIPPKKEKKSTKKPNTTVSVDNEKIKNDTKTENANFDKDISKTYINNSKPIIELVACLSYLLFFLPLIFCKKEPFARFHANQSLLLWITMAILYLAFVFIPNINVWVVPIIIIFHIIGIFWGMYDSAHGKAKTLPLIGKLTIIKWK